MKNNNTNQTKNTADKPVFRGELALLIAVIINSFGVVLMLHSGSGISAISSVPYAFSLAWNMDLYMSGNSYPYTYDTKEEIRSILPLQLYRRLCIF